jgi:hypothetical protein
VSAPTNSYDDNLRIAAQADAERRERTKRLKLAEEAYLKVMAEAEERAQEAFNAVWQTRERKEV